MAGDTTAAAPVSTQPTPTPTNQPNFNEPLPYGPVIETPAQKLAIAAHQNPGIVDNPVAATTLAHNPAVSGPALANTAGFMGLYNTAKNGISVAMKADATTSPSPGFWGDLQRYAKDAVNGVTTGLNTVDSSVASGIGALVHPNPNAMGDSAKFVGNFIGAIPGAADATWHAAEDAANRSANTAVEYLSGGGAHLVTDQGVMPSVQGHMDWSQAGSDVFHAPELLAGLAPNESASSTVQSRLAAYTDANALYTKQPTEGNYNAALSAYNSYQAAAKLHAAHPYLEDAMTSFRNLSPEELLGGNSQHNIYFNAIHTFAYYFSYAQRYGWGAALGQASVPLALAILTDGALSGEVGVGTAEYDSNLLATAAKAERSGTVLTPQETQAVAEASARTNARMLAGNLKENTISDATAAANAKMADLEAQRTAWGAAARTTQSVVGAGMKPLSALMKAVGPAATSVRMNLMYLAAQQQAMADPQTAQLWQKTASLDVYDAQGRSMGAPAASMLETLGAHPGSMAFSLLNPIAGFTDFALKWVGSDPLGAAGSIVGKARTADGLSGVLGKFFSGLGIHSVEDSFVAMRQYPSVNTAYHFMADAKGAGDILDRFPGTYTGAQAAEIARLTTADQVAEWHGIAAEANQLIKPLAPMMTTTDLLKMSLRNHLGAGTMKGQDWLFALGHLNNAELLSRFGLTAPQVEAEAASTSTEFRAVNQFGRWLSTRFAQAPQYWDPAMEHMVNTEFNPAEDNAISAVMNMYRIALFPEPLVKAVGDAMATANADERLVIFENANSFLALRRALAGIEGGVSTPLMEGMSKTINTSVAHFYTDGGGEKGVMVANDVTGGISRTIDPTNPGVPEVTAIRENQIGQYRFIDPRKARAMGVMAKYAAKRVPPSMIVNAEFSLKTLEEVQRAVEWARPNILDVVDHLHGMTDEVPSAIARNTQAIGGYRRAVGLLHETINIDHNLEGVDYLEQYTRTFDAVRQDYVKLAAMQDVGMRYAMLTKTADKTSQEYLNEIATLNSQIPEGLGINSVQDLTPAMRQALRGHLEAYRSIADKFGAELNDNFASHEEMARLAHDFRLLFENPDGTKAESNAITEADQVWADHFKAQVAKRPNYLNHWQQSMDILNLALSRTFVPLALFSGAWAFHISVSEGTLNAVRNGFGDTFESRIAHAIAKHVTGDTFVNKNILANDVLGYSDQELEAVKNVTTHTLRGVLNVLHNIGSGAIAGAERGLLNGFDQARLDRLIGDAIDVTILHDGQAAKMGVRHVSSTYDGARMDGASGNKGITVTDTGSAKKTKAFVGGNWQSASVRDRNGVTALSYWMRGIASDPIEAPVARKMYDILYNQGIEEVGPGGVREISDTVMKDLAVKDLGKKASKMSDQELISYADKNIPKSQISEAVNVKILDLGKASYKTPAAFADLRDEMEQFAEEHLKSLPDSTLARMNRTTRVSSFYTKELPEGDHQLLSAREGWAKALAHDVIGTTTGEEPVLTHLGGSTTLTRQEHVIHSSLLDQIANNRVKGAEDLIPDINAMKRGTEPQGIPSNRYSSVPLGEPGSGIAKLVNSRLENLHFINAASDLMHAHIFGPIANYLVRDPLYVLEYHNEMELLRAGLPGVSDMEMQTMAETRAAQKMIRYVHNPLDKLALEQNMRVISPFYFAQNQAWRRVMRLAYSDPGAAERYLKASMGVTNWISYEQQNNGSPFITIPGGQALTWMTNAMGQFFGPALTGNFSGFGPSGFGIGGYLGVSASMFPTGSSKDPANIASTIVRPSWGPVAIIAGDITKVLAGQVPWHQGMVARLVNSTLGPEATRNGWQSLVDPSSFFRAVTDLSEAAANAAFHGRLIGDKWTPSAVTSSQLLALLKGGEDQWAKSYNTVLAKVQNDATFKNGKFAPRGPGDPPLTSAQLTQMTRNKTYMQRILGLTGQEFASWLGGADSTTQSNNAQNLVASANMKSILLMAAQAIASLVSPISPDIQQVFMHDAQFNAIQAEKNANGTPKYTYAQAVQVFTDKYPGSYLDLLSRSYVANSDGPWPETQATVDFINTHPSVVKSYPIASAFLVPEHGTYYGPAFETLLTHGFRNRDDVQHMVNSMLINSGELYYKNVLEPEYGTNYAGLRTAAIAYGHTSNAVWYQYHTGLAYAYQGTQALSQMGAMVYDKNVPDTAFGSAQTRAGFAELVQMSNQALNAYQTASSTSRRSEMAAQWYTDISNAMKKPAAAPYASFMGQTMLYLLEEQKG